jgi:hypothetical protein
MPQMKSPSAKLLSVLLAGTLLLCHGAFGVVHLICDPPQCVAAARHAPEHRAAQAGAESGVHEHPAGHGANTEYFAVLAALLGLLLSLLPKGAAAWVGVGARRPPVVRRASDVFSPARGPTSPVLQVFRF